MRLNSAGFSRCLSGALVTALYGSLSTFTAQAASSLVSHQDASNELSIIVGRSVLLDCAQPVERVAVGTGDFAEAMVISPTEIMVNGKAAGETTLILWEAGGNRELFNVTVRPSTAAALDQLEGIRRELRSELPGQDVKLSRENGSVFLRGTVNDLTSSDRAVAIASVSGKVVNLLNVHVPPARAQVLLKCNFASVDGTKSRELGINLFNNGLGNWIGGSSTQQFSPPLLDPSGAVHLADDLNLFAFFPGLKIGTTIKALEDKGLVQILSEPNVLAEDGKQGSILAGGEYPYPVPQSSSTGGQTITIQFKEYGVRLVFLPMITPRGTIDLQVISEVSSLDFTNAVTISGYVVPAIAERRVKTQVELSKGQSFALGGLLDKRTIETFKKIPFIGDVPIIGKFFQSISKTKENNELIVIVTPEIVQPAAEGSIPLPNMAEKFLPQNSTTQMHHPDGTVPGAVGAAPALPAAATIPVEQLIESMKNPPTLTDTAGGYSSSGYSATSPGSGAGTGSPQ